MRYCIVICLWPGNKLIFAAFLQEIAGVNKVEWSTLYLVTYLSDGHTVALYLVLSSHSIKDTGSDPCPCLSMWTLHILPLHIWSPEKAYWNK